MSPEEFKRRTKQFALRVITMVESLPSGRTPDVVGRQLLRSATSVAANYRASCRAKSTADFCAKMGIVEEEADESLLWMEILVEANLVTHQRLRYLLKEGDEILSMVVASINTTRVRNAKVARRRCPVPPSIRNPKSEIRNGKGRKNASR